MQFTSRYAGYNMPVVEEERQFYPDGRSRLLKPGVWVDFGAQAIALETYAGVDSEDSPSFAQVRGGGFFDSVQGQKDNSWTDETRELVEQRLLEIADNGPNADEYRMLPPHQRPSGSATSASTRSRCRWRRSRTSTT